MNTSIFMSRINFLPNYATLSFLHHTLTFIQTATKSPEGLVRNHRFQIGLQFLAKEPEFAAFTKLQIDDKGDLADLPDYTTELYEAMTRVCAGEL